MWWSWVAYPPTRLRLVQTSEGHPFGCSTHIAFALQMQIHGRPRGWNYCWPDCRMAPPTVTELGNSIGSVGCSVDHYRCFLLLNERSYALHPDRDCMWEPDQIYS